MDSGEGRRAHAYGRASYPAFSPDEVGLPWTTSLAQALIIDMGSLGEPRDIEQ